MNQRSSLRHSHLRYVSLRSRACKNLACDTVMSCGRHQTADAHHPECLLWVKRVGLTSPPLLPVYPNERTCETGPAGPLGAMKRLMHCSKPHHYSITSSLKFCGER
jgi:hypothetical protein